MNTEAGEKATSTMWDLYPLTVRYKMADNTLYERTSEIRELIHIPRKRDILLRDRDLWHILWDSVDAIEDTEKILESFLKEDVNGSDRGIKRLLNDHVLNKLVAQQDAVEELHRILRIPYTKDSLLEKIRQVCTNAMENLTEEEEEKASDSVNISDLIATQKSIFFKDLNDIIKTLKKEELDHRKKFKSKKLSAVFGFTTYGFEKIYDAIVTENSPYAFIVDGHVDAILKSVEEFKTGLKERGEPDENITDIYENIDYSMKHIKSYFQNKKETHLHRKDVYIFAYFARRQVRELQNIAQDIDKEYSQGYIS